eukprot:COSAG01_NODE_32549_length_579_cov_1.027083_1_plen_100_part_10
MGAPLPLPSCCRWLPLLQLLSIQAIPAVAKIGDPSNDISFDADLVEQFLEYAETPLTKIKQRGPKKSSKHKVRDVRRTDPGASASKPLMHFLTTPGCGAC